MTARVVAWLSEGTWQAVVDTVATTLDSMNSVPDVVLLYVLDSQIGEAVQGAFSGLLGRRMPERDPGAAVTDAARTAASALLDAAHRRLGAPAESIVRAGRVEREVVAACTGADLLVCARDGDRSRLGPHSLGHATRFVVDHAPCAVLLIWPDTAPGLGSIPPHPGDHPGPHR
ncbi:MAG: universal stress protein [Actinomycetia bacterium]|nr:universal stress protein [Actinomycetes bacterium]MCH9702549.1 universal stress protein [Actinomycetes bacterium]MCH9759031.1 universal stress protein [Actinomycetes bacterium]